MTFQGIEITDADSLEAVADLRESYGEYCRTQADIYAAEAGWTADDDSDPMDEPPASAALAVPVPCRECGASGVRRFSTGGRLSDWIEVVCSDCAGTGSVPVPTLRYACPTCHDTGRVVKPSAFFTGKTTEGFCPDCVPHFDFQTRQFVGAVAVAATGEATPPTAPVPFDRRKHCQRIASFGGIATVTTHGTAHMRAIGKAGYRATVAAHGVNYAAGILSFKHWTPRTPDLLSDLRTGRELAALDRLAA